MAVQLIHCLEITPGLNTIAQAEQIVGLGFTRLPPSDCLNWDFMGLRD
jgi:hypothetical protein